ncbi:MAG: PIN domain-containing protein [Elusimicrobiota bacterium]|jgi:predicted nucleic acid-binding protein|nr:PIN domain-containing protein [Elusimicrobiota bacterium]
MSADKVFLDTNILVYLHSDADVLKYKKAVAIIEDYENCIVSTQVLSEFCNVCIKKLKRLPQEIESTIDDILEICELSTVSKETIRQAIYLQGRYKFSYYDSLIISSALENDCKYLFSEDLTDKQEIEGLVIKNIFAAQA